MGRCVWGWFSLGFSVVEDRFYIYNSLKPGDLCLWNSLSSHSTHIPYMYYLSGQSPIFEEKYYIAFKKCNFFTMVFTVVYNGVFWNFDPFIFYPFFIIFQFFSHPKLIQGLQRVGLPCRVHVAPSHVINLLVCSLFFPILFVLFYLSSVICNCKVNTTAMTAKFCILLLILM